MIILEIVIFLIAGGIAGTLAGLLGIGGGIILVPTQYFLYLWLLDFPPEFRIKAAIGTSLATIVFTSISSTISHALKGAVRYDVVLKWTIGVVLGAGTGTFIAKVVPAKILEVIFGLFIICLAIYFYWKKTESSNQRERPLPFFLLNLYGWAIGSIASMIGIGGGGFVVPTLHAYGIEIRKGIGTAAATGFVISLFGAALFLVYGLLYAGSPPPYSIGYIYIPALIPMAIGAVACAPLGVHLTHTLPVATIKKVFVVFLAASGLIMIFK